MEHWILFQQGTLIYLGLFLALLGGAIGLPIPEDAPLIVAGYLMHRGDVALQPVFIVCYSAIILGDIIIFWVGRKFGTALFRRPWFQTRKTQHRIKKIKIRLERQGFLMIFVARHLFYLRTITFLTCGAVRMRFRAFIIADLIAALVSVPLVLWLGYVFAENSERLYALIAKAQNAAIGILVLLLFGAGAIRYYLKRAEEREMNAENGKPSAEQRITGDR